MDSPQKPLLITDKDFSLSSLITSGRKNLASDFAQKVGQVFFTNVALIPLSLITSVLIARMLGPEGRGIFAVAFSILAIGVQFGNLGLHTSNTYLVAKDSKSLPQLLANSLVISIGLGGSLAILTWLIFYFWPNLAPINGLVLTLALGFIPFNLASLFLRNLLLGLQDIKAFNKVELFSKILTVLLLSLVYFLKSVTVEIVFAVGMLGILTSCVWAFWSLRKHFTHILQPSILVFKESIGYGLKTYLACFFAFLVLRADLLMINYMLDVGQAGYYSVSTSLADLLYLLPTAISTILFPKLASMGSEKDKWAMTQKVMRISGLILLPIILTAILLAHPIIVFFFGQSFEPAIDPFIILCIAMYFYGVNNIVGIYLASIGMPWFAVYVWIIASILNIVINLYLIPAYGISGAAFSSLICYFLVFIFQLLFAIKWNNR